MRLIADGIVEMIHERGVTLAAPGRPVQHPGCEEVRAVVAPDMLRPASPPSHILLKLLRASADGVYATLLSEGSQRDRTRLRSAGGPSAGKSLVAPAGLSSTHYADEEFVEVVRWRLRVADVGEALRCRNVAAKTMTECGHDRDREGDHAVCCNVADGLGDIVAETGAHVRRDAFVAARSVLSQKAWLDL